MTALNYIVGTQVLELGIVAHSVVIGLSMGASNNTFIINPIVAALCFHQMFEGMGLGGCILQVITNLYIVYTNSTPALILYMYDQELMRKMLHACIQAEYKFVKKAWMVFFFSVTTPFGIALGIALSKTYKENSPTSLISVGLLNASSAGLLIYMALVDLLSADFMGPKLQGSIKLQIKSFVAVLLGAGGMSVMAKWA